MNPEKATLLDAGPAHDATVADSAAHDATLVATADAQTARTVGRAEGAQLLTGRTMPSVLPRIEDGGAVPKLVPPGTQRYESIKKLGAGGMGEVKLVRDNDIGRTVAVKQLLPGLGHPSVVARFVDEVRVIGSLEHPNITPIHDVGVDEDGRYFFVMKFVDGETLESILEKLAAGDPKYLAEYTNERRIEIFIGVLRALAFAHARGVIHRDIKPANVMIGKFGEVVLMDWGVAKQLGTAERALPDELIPEEEKSRAAQPLRASTTRYGTLVGTPAYMSPEQAGMKNADLDTRSDLYAATVMFHELLTLRHMCTDMQSLPELLGWIAGSEELGFFAIAKTKGGRTMPAELIHFVIRGLKKDPAQRWQSADIMIDELEAILEGRIRVQCPFTMTKRMARESGRFVDAYPFLAVTLFFGGGLFAIGGAVSAIVMAVS